MTILEFQEKVAERLNNVEELVKGGAKAICEDALDVAAAVREQLEQMGGVAVVVTTPRLDRNGCAEGLIPCTASLDIRCVERPALNRESESHITALDAARLVARELDGALYNFRSIDQRVDERTGRLSATASFETVIWI